MSSGIIRAIHEIAYLARQADVNGTPRVSITFDTPRDREIFKAEIKRQLEASEVSFVGSQFDWSEATIAGVKVRII